MKALLGDDAMAAYACALAWQLGHGQSPAVRKSYGDKAIEILNDWSRHNQTVAPRTVYEVDGDSSLCMAYNGTALVFAAELVWNHPDWSAADKSSFKAWARRCLYYAAEHLRTFPKHVNCNRGLWGSLAALAVDHLTDDRAGMVRDIAILKAQIDAQIASDGRLPAEIERGAHSMWYTYFALAPMTAAVEIVRNATGEILYDWKPPSGGSIRDALHFLFRHGREEPSAWPVAGAVNQFTGSSPAAASLYQAMGVIFREDAWLHWLQPPVWRDKTGLAWICPTLMQPLPLP